MLRRKIRDADDARACLEAVAHSGLPRAQWAQQNGIDARSLNIWRVIFNRTGASPPPLRLVELVADEPTVSSRYTLHFRDFLIDVDARFEADSLRRLLTVLATC
jgi:hypothetical protein